MLDQFVVQFLALLLTLPFLTADGYLKWNGQCKLSVIEKNTTDSFTLLSNLVRIR